MDFICRYKVISQVAVKPSYTTFGCPSGWCYRFRGGEGKDLNMSTAICPFSAQLTDNPCVLRNSSAISRFSSLSSASRTLYPWCRTVFECLRLGRDSVRQWRLWPFPGGYSVLSGTRSVLCSLVSSLQEHLEKRSCIEQTGTDFLGGYGHLSTRSYALFKCRLKNVPLKQSLFSREEYPVYKNW